MTKLLPAVIAAAITFVGATAARAQPGLVQPTSPAPVEPPAAPAGEAKSEQTATLLALGGTALPLVLFIAAGNTDNSDKASTLGLAGVASLILTPSAGHWYAGKYFTTGMGLRLAGGAATLLGGAIALGCALSEGGDDSCDGAAGALLLFGGLGTLATGIIYDIATADNEVRAHNARLAPAISVVPTVVRSGSSTTPGLVVAGTF